MRANKDSVWQAECLIAEHMPTSYKQHALLELEYEVSRKLWHSLQEVSNPCVVEMFNDERDEYIDGMYCASDKPARRFRMGYRLIAVKHNHVTLASADRDYDAAKRAVIGNTLTPKQPNFFQKFRQRWLTSTWLV